VRRPDFQLGRLRRGIRGGRHGSTHPARPRWRRRPSASILLRGGRASAAASSSSVVKPSCFASSGIERRNGRRGCRNWPARIRAAGIRRGRALLPSPAKRRGGVGVGGLCRKLTTAGPLRRPPPPTPPHQRASRVGGGEEEPLLLAPRTSPPGALSRLRGSEASEARSRGWVGATHGEVVPVRDASRFATSSLVTRVEARRAVARRLRRRRGGPGIIRRRLQTGGRTDARFRRD